MSGHDAVMIKYVESRLEEWRYYYNRVYDGASGYHSKNILAAWREGYSIQNQPRGKQYMEVNDSAEEIEKIVCEMSDYDARLAIALRCHYFSYAKNLRAQAEKMNISHTLFRIYVMAAKTWVASRLSMRRRS